MTRQIRTVKVIGLGKVGELVATLLGDAGFTVSAYDARPRADLPFSTEALDVRDAEALRAALKGTDAVVSCLPYHLNLPVAEVANEVRGHFSGRVYDVQIPRNVRLSEAPSFGKPILLYDLASKGAMARG